MGFVKTPPELAKIGQMQAVFYNADMLFAFWQTKPEIIEHLLPPPLEPAGLPLASAFIADYPRTSFGPPYQEAALFVSAQHDGIAGSYCLAMPVTGDLAMAAGRERFGFPKKIAQQIQLQQTGDEMHGFVERNGSRFVEMSFTPDEQGVEEFFKAAITESFGFQTGAGAGTYLFKHFLAPDKAGFDYPPRLILQHTIFNPRTLQWGVADVKLFHSDCDPWEEVEVVNMLGGMRIIGDNTMLAGKVVAETDPEQFMPYAYTRWDW
jgi:acetoacetate decarboxylase